MRKKEGANPFVIIFVILIIILNFWLMGGGHSGRGQDYYETQTDQSSSP